MKLEIGYNHAFEVRREQCTFNCKDNFSILYLSDLHLNGFTSKTAEAVAQKIHELDPTIILLGGDYVDSQKGLEHLNTFLRSISHRQHVFAIAGNHDYSFGIGKIQQTVVGNNVTWIENKTFNLHLKETTIKIDGNFVNTEDTDAEFSILCLHKPQNVEEFKDRYNIAFAGHLHGSQVVFREVHDQLFPGRFFYKWNILKTTVDNCRYFISKGLGDTLPVRYNCKKDMLFIEVTGRN